MSTKPPHSIEQISNLNLPSRQEIRRPVYVGEKLTCHLESPSLQGKADIVDLSALGAAVIFPAEHAHLMPKLKDKVSLLFTRKDVKPFKIQAEIRNISEIAYRKSKFIRLGMQYVLKIFKSAETFHAAIGKKLMSCHPFIRPQVTYRDPFFFNERIICHVNAFTHEGIELLCPARSKTMFPNQSIELQIYIPGQSIFKVMAVNSTLYFQTNNDMVARYLVYSEPNLAFLEAVSQYLVTFQNAVSPQLLRAEKFRVGSLLQGFNIEYSNPASEFVKKAHFAPSLFARPMNSKEFILPFGARPVSCQMGEHFVALFGVLFVDRNREKSLLVSQGHKLTDLTLKAGHVELVELFISPSISLADCFLPILQQVVRIASQAAAKFVCFEASPKLASSLKKIGLREAGTSLFIDSEKNKIASCLFELDLAKVLPNSERFLSDHVWNKIYGEIAGFLDR